MKEQMTAVQTFVMSFLELSVLLLAFALGIGLLAIAYMYIVDITQKEQTIRRNYPVIGRFRYFFEHLGEFFRQYFFALDREELPFNRAPILGVPGRQEYRFHRGLWLYQPPEYTWRFYFPEWPVPAIG